MVLPEETEQEPLPVVTGNAWALGLGVTAEILLPREHWGQTAPGNLLLTGIDPTFPDRIDAGDIIVGGGHFGAGIEDESPIEALLGSGVGAVIASSFDADFARMGRARGLPLAEVNEALGIHTGERLRVDLEGLRVVNMSSGDRFPIRNLGGEAIACLRDGYWNRHR